MPKQLHSFDRWRTNFTALLEHLHTVNSISNIGLVGGSLRNSHGQWLSGCSKLAARNYTLEIRAGYDMEIGSCMVCDYVHGPFVMKVDTFRHVIDSNLDGEPFYADIMLRLGFHNLVALSCPDVLFNVVEKSKAIGKTPQWVVFAAKYHFHLVKFWNSELRFSCEETNTKCYDQGTSGEMIPLCCYQELQSAITFVTKEFETHNLTYELCEGSDLGPSKLGQILPWEFDVDMNFETKNITAAMKLAKKFELHGLKMFEEGRDKSWCYNADEHNNCGFIKIRSKHWRFELWGMKNLTLHHSMLKSMSHSYLLQTKFNVAGQWVISLYAPFTMAYNRYGPNILLHVEHWTKLGRNSSFTKYSPGHFKQCERPGFHACLRGNYMPVGSLQFKDIRL